MSLSRLKKVSDYEVRRWIEESIPELTVYQKQRIYSDEIVRFSPYYFYEEKQKEKVSFLWRFTILAIPIYLPMIICGLPIKMLFTGKWGYGMKFYDKFHSVWMHKVGLDILS